MPPPLYCAPPQSLLERVRFLNVDRITFEEMKRLGSLMGLRIIERRRDSSEKVAAAEQAIRAAIEARGEVLV